MITRALVVLNIIVFAWEVYAGGLGVFNGNIPDTSPIGRYVLYPAAITVGHQYYRIVTAAFLHGSIMHIFVNMLSLFWLGRFIEMALRPFKTLLVYVIAMIVSGLSVVMFSPPDAATLGASGAIFGLFGALFAIGIKLGGRAGNDLVKSNIGILMFNLIFSFAVPGISWQAHIGGLIAGFIATFVIFQRPKPVYARAVDPHTGVEYESRLEEPQ